MAYISTKLTKARSSRVVNGHWSTAFTCTIIKMCKNDATRSAWSHFSSILPKHFLKTANVVQAVWFTSYTRLSTLVERPSRLCFVGLPEPGFLAMLPISFYHFRNSLTPSRLTRRHWMSCLSSHTMDKGLRPRFHSTIPVSSCNRQELSRSRSCSLLKVHVTSHASWLWWCNSAMCYVMRYALRTVLTCLQESMQESTLFIQHIISSAIYDANNSTASTNYISAKYLL